MSESIRILLPDGFDGWLIFSPHSPQTICAEADGTIAPMAHCDKSGRLSLAALWSDSYAHLFPGEGVVRYGRTICDWSDITPLTTDPETN